MSLPKAADNAEKTVGAQQSRAHKSLEYINLHHKSKKKNTFGLWLIFYQPAQSYCLVQAGKAFSNFAFLKRGFGSVFPTLPKPLQASGAPQRLRDR